MGHWYVEGVVAGTEHAFPIPRNEGHPSRDDSRLTLGTEHYSPLTGSYQIQRAVPRLGRGRCTLCVEWIDLGKARRPRPNSTSLRLQKGSR